MNLLESTGKLICLPPYCQLMSTDTVNGIHYFQEFDEEVIGVILEVRQYLGVDTKFEVHEFDVLIGESTYVYSYRAWDDINFLILEEN